jgi:rhamnose ABC transporter rhamnose-binding protein
MKSYRSLIVLLAMAAIVAALVACAAPAAPPAAAPQPAEEQAKPTEEAMAKEEAMPAVPEGWKAGLATNPPDMAGQKITIADVPKLIGIDYFNATAKGMQEAAAELGNVEVITDAPTEAKIEKQIEFIDNFITQGVDVIMYASNDPVAIAPVLRTALEQGIRVVGYDADAEEDAREFFVNQASFEGIGYTLVDVMAEEAGEDAQVAIVTSSLTAPNQNTWIEFMKERMETKYPNMKLLDIRPSEEDQNLAFQVTQDLLKAYPDIDGVFGISSVAFPGAADAVRDAGKCGQVHVTGLSTPNVMRQFVKEGCVNTVVLWNPVDLGYAAVYAARRLVDGELKPGDTELDAGKLGKLPITGSEILLGPPFKFTIDNIDDFDF